MSDHPAKKNAKQMGQAARAQADLDVLVKTSTAAGVAALAPLRVGVRKALSMSETPDQLRHHLVMLLYEESAMKFAQVLERSRILANLNGRLVVIDDVKGDAT